MIDEKYKVKTKFNNEFVTADLRLLEDGISIANEFKSILIKYNYVKKLVLDKDLFLNIIYTSNSQTASNCLTEKIEASEKLIELIKNKTKIKVSKEKIKKDSVILKGKCRLKEDSKELVEFYQTHRKIILVEPNTGNNYIIETKKIENIEKISNTGIRFSYENHVQEIHYENTDKIVENINKYLSENYADTFELTSTKKQFPLFYLIFFLFTIISLIGISLIVTKLN